MEENRNYLKCQLTIRFLQVIKDYKLFMVVGVLVAIDVVTLTTWQIVDPFYRETSLGVAVVSSLLFLFYSP